MRKKWIFAVLFAVLLLVWPETALNAAREAMHTWTYTVAPSLFPFMALMPLLTCQAACRAYKRLLGPVMQTVFRLPGESAPAVVIAMTAGSPAGAHALRKISREIHLPDDQQQRIMTCCCGLSPAFLVTGIGAGMLGAPQNGRILLFAQICTQTTMLLLTRPKRVVTAPATLPEESAPDTLVQAVMATLGVCGYMILFNIIAAFSENAFQMPTLGLVARIILDLPTAAKAIAALEINRKIQLIALAGLSGYGGLCIAAQNLAACPGISWGKFLRSRITSACLNAAYATVWMSVPLQIDRNPLLTLRISIFFSAIFAVPGVIFLEIDQFLNNSKDRKKSAKRHEKRNILW